MFRIVFNSSILQAHVLRAIVAASCVCFFAICNLSANAAAQTGSQSELQRLAWMLGEWSTNGSGQTTEMTCRWTDDGHFLLVDLRIQNNGTAEHFSTERIAWDAAAKNIRSWIFRSDGSFGESTWTPKEKGWQVKTRGVATSGEAIRGTVLWFPMDDGRLALRSEGVRIGNESVPDVELIMTRRGDPPGPMPRGNASAIENVSWELYEMNGVPMEFDRPLAIKLNGGKLEATGTVNRIGGSYTLNGTSLRFSRLMATTMAGPPELMELESVFTKMLESVDSFQPDGLELHLMNGAETLARLRPGR